MAGLLEDCSPLGQQKLVIFCTPCPSRAALAKLRGRGVDWRVSELARISLGYESEPEPMETRDGLQGLRAFSAAPGDPIVQK